MFNRNYVISEGRTAFYACILGDIKELAADNGWAIGIHGSLKSDMDLIAVPWTKEAITFKDLIIKISSLFKDNMLAEQYQIDKETKPNGRVVATIPIWDDYYLDINTMMGELT